MDLPMKVGATGFSRPHPREVENGDAYSVRVREDVTILAVIDGLGHGANAALASRRAVEYLNGASLQEDVLSLMQGLDRALKGTRGAGATLCRIESDTLTGCGVGNVELRVLGTKIPIVLSQGTLGQGVRRYRVFSGLVRGGERLFLHSDGISPRGVLDKLRFTPRDEAGDLLLSAHARENDDATVLIADIEV